MTHQEKEELKLALAENLPDFNSKLDFLEKWFPSEEIFDDEMKDLFTWFEQHNMLGSLMACMNTEFDLDLTMTV